MKQKIENTIYGKSLVIEKFNPETTTIGLTPKGLVGINAIVIKNFLNSNYDFFMINQGNGHFELVSSQIENPFYLVFVLLF